MGLLISSIIAIIISLMGLCAKNKLNKIDQTQLQTYEGKLLICGYMDENLPPQEVFDISQLDEKGLMAIIYVNQDVEPIVYENAVIGYDEEGLCGIVIL